MYRIAIEEGLTPFAQALQAQGYEISVIGFNTENESLDQVDAVVVSGMHENFLGQHKIKTEAPVINAEGRTPDDVVHAIKQSLKVH